MNMKITRITADSGHAPLEADAAPLEPSAQDIASMTLDDVEHQAAQWRAAASKGYREAFGIAHIYETELRRRVPRETEPGALLELPKDAAVARERFSLRRLFSRN